MRVHMIANAHIDPVDRYEGMQRPAWDAVRPRGLWGPAMLRNFEQGRVSDPGPSGSGGGLFNRPGHDYAG